MNEVDEEIPRFDTYRAMSRVAMFAGVPVFAGIFLFMGAFVSLFAGVYLWEWGGLIPPSFFLIAIMVLRIICARDDKAFRRVRFFLRRIKLNRRYGRLLLITTRTKDWRMNNARRVIRKQILAGEK